MAKPKFYLEKRKDKDGNLMVKDVPILMFYSYGAGRLQYYTGQRVDSKNYVDNYWSKGRDPIKASAPNSTNINNALDILAADVVSFHNDAKSAGIVPDNDYFRKLLDAKHKPKPIKLEKTHDFVSFLDLVVAGRESGERVITTGKNKGRPHKPNGIKSFKTLQSAIKGYMKDARLKEIPFDSIGRQFYDSFRKHVLTVMKNEISTFSTHIKIVKTVMQEAFDEGLHKNMDFRAAYFFTPSYEPDTVSVSTEYLEKVEQLDLTNHPYLDNTRDLFLIGCYSALRYSDFSTLSVADISDNFIRIVQVKTGESVTIPVMKKMKALIDKYKGGLPRPISNQKFNKYIKEVFKMAKLTHVVKVKNTTGGIEGYKEVEYYNLISSHTARRTYATNMFKAGVPSMLIMAITGHKTESSFLKYIRATNEDKAYMMAEMMKKLGL